MRNERYNISVDIGTNSVGWAVTDMESFLLKKGEKNLWGVNLFDKANTAADRRMARGARRRYKRRRQRISLLQDLMAVMIGPIDPNFYCRLLISYMDEEDREKALFTNPNNVIFGNSIPSYGYGKDYSKTIYHLRKHLMECDYKEDPRLIYLALHHMVKYRGNFLYEGQDLKTSGNQNVVERMNDVFEMMNQYYDTEAFSSVDKEIILTILENQNVKLKERLENVASEKSLDGLEKEQKDAVKEIARALLGYSFNYKKLVNRTKDVKFKLSDDFDDIEKKVEEEIGDSELLNALYEVYNHVVLSKIMGDVKEGTYSDAMIAVYDKHKRDLEDLKRIFRAKLSRKEYNTFFKTQEKDNYYSWIRNPKDCKQDDFFKKIKKLLTQCNTSGEDDDELNAIKVRILDDIENMNFLPKQTNATNAAVPFQLNLEEMERIIDNQGRFYPELLDSKDKIISILTFRIPYYVGPLVTKNYNNHAWIERKIDVALRPWNFNDVVNKEVTAEKFITKMRNHCTYLLAEPALPKNSLLYSEYEVYNELNKIRVRGELLDIDKKNDIVKNLFKKQSVVTLEKFRDFLADEQIVIVNGNNKLTVEDISGTQKKDRFASSLKPWIDFMDIYGDDFDASQDEIERIIEWLTVYNDKNILRTRIEKEYPHLSPERIDKIVKLKYSGYGRISRKLLKDIPIVLKNGVCGFVMDALKETNKNFMQVLNTKKYGLQDEIKLLNDIVNSKTSLNEIVRELPGSPALKRGILQTLRIIEEIEDYFGHPAENIFVEMAREEGEKKRTSSREEKYKKIYDGLIKDKITIDGQLISKMNDAYIAITDDNLKDEKILLYVLQNGKSLYSKKALDINHLENCEIDHIIPQSYTKDDSIDNKALVLREENQLKRDDLLLSKDVVDACSGYWRDLWKNKLISDKKYYNLLKARKGISDDEKIGFINRQLVETRQICKHVVNILKERNPDTNVISIYAGLSSEFRSRHELYKLRSINDTHHAHDAYLAAVVGNFILRKYPFMKTELSFSSVFDRKNHEKKEALLKEIDKRRKEEANSLKSNRPYTFNSFIIWQMGKYPVVNNWSGEVIWDVDKLNYVKKALGYKDYFITYKTESGQAKLFEKLSGKNKFKDSGIEGHNGYSLKKNRPFVKYGGYKSSEVAYGIIIEYKDSKQKKVRSVETIPMNLYYANDERIKEYLAVKCNCDRDDIKLIKKIWKNQLMISDDNLVTMASPSEWNIRSQLFIPDDLKKTAYYVEKNYIKNLDDAKLINLFDVVLKSTKENLPAMISQCNAVLDKRDEFILLSVENKVKALRQIIAGCSSGKDNPDVKFEDTVIKARLGRLNMKRINPDKTTFIFQSVTGIYCKKVKL